MIKNASVHLLLYYFLTVRAIFNLAFSMDLKEKKIHKINYDEE